MEDNAVSRAGVHAGITQEKASFGPDFTEQMHWFEPVVDQCNKDDSTTDNATEACLGTERICQQIVSSGFRDECFKARGLVPFLLASLSKCGKRYTEKCIGSYKWCHENYQDAGYFNGSECFSRRGFDQDKFFARVKEEFKPLFNNAMLMFQENVTYGAVLRSQVLSRGDTNDLKEETWINESMAKYLGDLENNGFKEALGKYLANFMRHSSK